jgi:hypothetical protein
MVTKTELLETVVAWVVLWDLQKEEDFKDVEEQEVREEEEVKEEEEEALLDLDQFISSA